MKSSRPWKHFRLWLAEIMMDVGYSILPRDCEISRIWAKHAKCAAKEILSKYPIDSNAPPETEKE